MRRTLRIFALAVLIAIVCAAALAQLRFFSVAWPAGRLLFPSDGVALYIFHDTDRHFEVRWDKVTVPPMGWNYLLPNHVMLLGGDYFSLPWLWIVSAWGIFTAVVYRLTRAKPTPSAFPVEGDGGPPP